MMREYYGKPSFYVWDGKSITINGKTISHDTQEQTFLCNNKVVKPITYSSDKGRLGEDGGWGSTYIIDCEDSYWIYSSTDANPSSISGPFFFSESADFLKQKAQDLQNCYLNLTQSNSTESEYYSNFITCESYSF